MKHGSNFITFITNGNSCNLENEKNRNSKKENKKEKEKQTINLGQSFCIMNVSNNLFLSAHENLESDWGMLQ